MNKSKNYRSFLGSLVAAIAATLILSSTAYAGLGWNNHGVDKSSSTKSLDSSKKFGFKLGDFQANCGIGGDICGKTFPIGFLPLLKSDFTKKLIGLEVGREYTLTFYNMNMGFNAGGEIGDLEGWKMNIGGIISIVEEDKLTFTFTATASTTLIKITPKASGRMKFSMPLGFKVTCGEVSNVTCITLKTDDKGNYCTTEVPEGEANVTVIETTLPDGATLTAGVNPNDITVIAGQQNDAGTDGYTFSIPPVLKGTVYGTVYEDENHDGIQQPSETGEAGIQLTILDANGDVHTIETDDKGDYSLDVIEGNTIITLDIDTLPPGTAHATGDIEDEITVITNQSNFAGKDAYVKYTE